MGQSISYPGAKDSFLFFDLYLSGPVLKPPIQQRKERVAARIVLQLIDGISQGRGWSAICKRAGCTVRFATPTTSAFTIFTIFRTFRI